jgi:voltage-gated potassium channel
MIILGLVWLVLLVVELTAGLTPLLAALGVLIWCVFLFDFALELILAPERGTYLRRNWLTALALLVPALRVFRIARAVRVLGTLRAARGLRLVRVITSMNRSMHALRRTLARRGFGYVVALTVIVTFAGAAGMYAFEVDSESAQGAGGLNSFPDALWWTAMVMTTSGSDYWPRSAEGRLLCLLLSLYAFAVFGYVTATLASFLVGRDADNPEAELAGAAEIRQLRGELNSLRQELKNTFLQEGGLR